MEAVQFTVHLSILKPVHEVFDAVVNPQKLSGYFTQTASAPLQPGTTVSWRFAEFPADIPVIVDEVIPNELITLEWESAEGGYNTRVEMRFESLDEKSTLVSIKESGWRKTPKGILGSYQNCSGWMNMLCCLKAYLEYGLNLRKGAFLKPEVYSA